MGPLTTTLPSITAAHALLYLLSYLLPPRGPLCLYPLLTSPPLPPAGAPQHPVMELPPQDLPNPGFCLQPSLPPPTSRSVVLPTTSPFRGRIAPHGQKAPCGQGVWYVWYDAQKLTWGLRIATHHLKGSKTHTPDHKTCKSPLPSLLRTAQAHCWAIPHMAPQPHHTLNSPPPHIPVLGASCLEPDSSTPPASPSHPNPLS